MKDKTNQPLALLVPINTWPKGGQAKSSDAAAVAGMFLEQQGRKAAAQDQR